MIAVRRTLFQAIMLGLASICVPACTAYMPSKWVDVRFRDARTHAPVPDGQYEAKSILWGLAIPPYFEQGGGGGFEGSHIYKQITVWTNEHVAITPKGYGTSKLSYFMTPGGKEGHIAVDWKRARLIAKDGREIEYQIAYPRIGSEGVPQSSKK